ncbi:hypothetical protein PGT21_022037 [Puccinia graminis f. sp. tritici]|uniref:Uncharacterized protein n=1 Tax=Puccinia graminis f. sp. tritici TaxID=56615 RepID=A0A5B0QP23_PUCGR|nr:hypothetical protein PGT21_022037 [Puccinia graminis f. sp. tritici]
MELKFLAPIKLDLAINSATLGIDEPSEAANCNSPAYQQSEIKKPILRVAIVDGTDGVEQVEEDSFTRRRKSLSISG